MPNLAWANLTLKKSRTAVAVAGVTFAVVLMFMQLGFLASVENTATIIYDALKFDILLRSPSYLHMTDARSFPIVRLQQAASTNGVSQAVPFHIAYNRWQNPLNLEQWGIITMGVQPGSDVFTLQELRDKVPALASPEAVLIDRKSQSKYGPVNGEKFGDKDIGQATELMNKRVRIAGHFGLGAGLSANASVVLNDAGFRRVTPRRKDTDVSLGLVQMAAGATAAEIEATARKIQESLSDQQDVVVMTRTEAIRKERRYWLFDKSIGVIFMMGVAVAFVVGLAIVYQVLATDVANHLGEYATLKAMGYRNRYLAKVVVNQAIILGLLGYASGYVLSVLLFTFTSRGAGIPIEMDWRIRVVVFVASLLMCVLSGLLALRKAYTADPADLF